VSVVAQPLIAVADVEASSRWYCHLLGATSGHGGKEYDRVMVGDDFVMQLHDWNAHEHRYLGDEQVRPWGNGTLLWFRVDDFDEAVARAGELGAEILEERHRNPRASHEEIWIRDPDGYVVVLAGALTIPATQETDPRAQL
jgi:catechol 2,3-dioxygenase-like lactoylglutathione lyase family enzyme